MIANFVSLRFMPLVFACVATVGVAAFVSVPAAPVDDSAVDEPIVTVEGSAGVLAEREPIVTVEGSAGVLAEDAVVSDAAALPYQDVLTLESVTSAPVVSEPAAPSAVSVPSSAGDNVSPVRSTGVTQAAAPASPSAVVASAAPAAPVASEPQGEVGDATAVEIAFECSVDGVVVATVRLSSDCYAEMDAAGANVPYEVAGGWLLPAVSVSKVVRTFVNGELVSIEPATA